MNDFGNVHLTGDSLVLPGKAVASTAICWLLYNLCLAPVLYCLHHTTVTILHGMDFQWISVDSYYVHVAI